jgi:hypothetical protein
LEAIRSAWIKEYGEMPAGFSELQEWNDLIDAKTAMTAAERDRYTEASDDRTVPRKIFKPVLQRVKTNL